MRYSPEVRYALRDEPSYPPTYYPNALAISDAAQIEILSGTELSGIDFRLVRTRAFKITGTLVGAASGRMNDIQLSPVGTEGLSWERMRRATTDEKGNFIFQDLRPGRYLLSAEVVTQDRVKTAQANVVIADADLEGLQLSAAANHELPGSIRVEGASEWSERGLNIILETEDRIRMTAAEVKKDGTFRFESVPLDRVQVRLGPTPDGYIKSIRLGPQEVQGTLLDFSEGVPGELSITLSPKAATVTGKVNDEKDRPATSGLVVLVPEVRKRTDLYLEGVPDQNGTYSIKNVPPGSYKIFAFDKVETGGACQDPDWLKPFEEKGESIEVKESERPTKDLKLIVTEEAE